MANIKKCSTELIGGTPLLKLVNFEKKENITETTIFAKLEYLNPAGSVKEELHWQWLQSWFLQKAQKE